MNVEIISIGTELLLGHIINTNAAFLSQRLAEVGIDVYYHTTIGDNPSRLDQAIRKALGRSDVVITTGGLGPTVDDITIETVARLVNKKLILNKMLLEDLKDYFKLRNVKLPPDAVRQAYIPEGSIWIRNRVGTAPGLIVEDAGTAKTVICLPGPPREIEPMFKERVIPYLAKKGEGTSSLICRSIRIAGLPESAVNAKVKDLLMLTPPTTLGIYAKLSEVTLKIMAKAKSRKEADAAIRRMESKIRARFKDYIFGCDEETLEGAVARILIRKGMTVATAESCTGGLLANRITNVSGSSNYFIMGVIAYSDKSKANILGVSEKSIGKYGAVSRQVALEMAKGIRCLAGTSLGIGVTGIAGPTGGTKKKPVGLVHIAITSPRKTIAQEFYFKGSREEIKFQASQAALDMIRRNVLFGDRG